VYCFKAFAVDAASGVITINNLIPQKDIAYPQGATHLSLTGAMADIDFTNGTSDLQATNVENLPLT